MNRRVIRETIARSLSEKIAKSNMVDDHADRPRSKAGDPLQLVSGHLICDRKSWIGRIGVMTRVRPASKAPLKPRIDDSTRPAASDEIVSILVARVFIIQKRWAQASRELAILRGKTSGDPKLHAMVLALLGKCQEALGKTDKARTAFLTARDHSPSAPVG